MKTIVAAAFLCLAGVSSAHSYTYIDLVKKLADLDALAVLAAPGERCAQWSSYDRASRWDEATGKYVNWEANGDGNGVIRMEGDTAVIAEMEGPGCIWRIWSARPAEGHVKIFLDGASEPAVDLPFSGYFDGKNAPFIYPSLVHDAASGKNCYVPIPFAKSCKITAEKGWGDYYHFTYTTYPKGTVVPTFKRELSPEEIAALEAADEYLRNGLGEPRVQRKGEIIQTRKVILGREPTVVARISGPRAITAIWVKPDLSKVSEPRAALRNAVLSIRWDGEKEPSVWAPLGDFFGTGPGVNLYRSLPMGMTEQGYYSFWYMPFAREALVEMLSEGGEPLTVEVSITTALLTRPIGELGRFHAKWHRDALLPAEPERWIDWPMLVTKGRGRFCGVMLHVWNPEGGWWGEGDEKFWVDGEKFPSTFGTGSEDYFGYAWGNPSLFQNAFHNQTLCENGNKGHVSVNRWHITDNVPFQTGFEADIEKYFKNDRPTLYSAVAYWYLAPGGTDPYRPVPAGERWGLYRESAP